MAAQSLFVGREREQQCYRELLSSESPWLLVITGQGGNGKSTLLRRLAEQTPIDIPVVILNFTSDVLCVDGLKVLDGVADQLETHCARQAVQAFKKALQQGRNELAASKHMSETIIASEHAMVQGNQLTMGAATSEQRRQVRETVRTALFAMVDTLRTDRLVIMLDTCERLQEAEGFGMNEVGKWVMDDLIPGLHSRLHKKGRHCLVVAASRIDPQFEGIDEQERRHLVLPMLDKPAVEEYLQRVGMHDVALRQRVYELTHGHALCVSIIGSLWQERGDRPFTLLDLPTLKEQYTERALLKFVGERILDKRLKTPFRELTRYGVLLRSFNLPMLRAVFPELLSEPGALERFQQLIRYPYVESLGNYHYTFHNLLREIQAEEIREQEPEKWHDYHKRALEFLTQSAWRSPDWYYHAIAYDEKQGMSEWWEIVQEAQLRGEREYWATILQAAHDGALKLSAAASAQCAYLQGNFFYYGAEMLAALTSYEQALTLFRQVGDRLGEANVRKAMGDVQQFRTDMQAALASYEQALTLFRQVGSKVGEANVLQAMGDVQQFRDEREAALASYEQALTLYRQVGDRLGEANVLQAMGDVQQFRKDMQAALASYEQALTLYRQVGSKVGEANCYLAQGSVALEQKDYQRSLALHTDAYRLYQHIQDAYSQARLLYYRSMVYEAMNEKNLAMKDLETTLTIARALDLPFVGLLQKRLEELHGK